MNMKINNYSESVCQIENVIPHEKCIWIIDRCEKSGKWCKATTVGENAGIHDASSSPRQNSVIGISGNVHFKDVDDMLYIAYRDGLQAYLKSINSSIEEAGISEDEGYGILRYDKNNFYKKHVDYLGKSLNKSSPLIRVLTGILYLNEDFTGGETYLHNQDLKIKPKTGSLLLFPSIFTHPHESMPITHGKKYCAVTWWR